MPVARRSTTISADSSTMRPASAAPSISDGASNHAVATPSTTRQSVPISVMPGTVVPTPDGLLPDSDDASTPARTVDPCSDLSSPGAGRTSLMGQLRAFDHVGITVADLDVATAFFVGLGLEVEGRTFVEGEFIDTVCGIPDSRTEIVMLRPPGGGTAVELSSFIRPDHDPGSPTAMANELGLRSVAFEVDDLHAAVDRLAADGYGLVGGVGQYENTWLMAYVRGPEGIIVALAERLDVSGGSPGGSVWFGEVAVFVDLLQQVGVDEDVRFHQPQRQIGVVFEQLWDFSRRALGERLVGDVGVGEWEADRTIRGVVERAYLIAGHRVGTEHLFIDALGHILLITHGDRSTPIRRQTQPAGEPDRPTDRFFRWHFARDASSIEW